MVFCPVWRCGVHCVVVCTLLQYVCCWGVLHIMLCFVFCCASRLLCNWLCCAEEPKEVSFAFFRGGDYPLLHAPQGSLSPQFVSEFVTQNLWREDPKNSESDTPSCVAGW